MINIIFGIIIDTFAELRSKKKESYDNINDHCLICNIDRFCVAHGDKISFNWHLQHEHNIWKYYFFIYHISKKKYKDLNSLESIVVSMVHYYYNNVI